MKKLRNGQRIVISYGNKREKVAVIVPYSAYASTPERSLGLLKDRAGCIIHDNFEISEKEMPASLTYYWIPMDFYGRFHTKTPLAVSLSGRLFSEK